MKFLKKTAGVLIIMLAVMFLSGGVSFADYEFDDLVGNGIGTQWMIINEAGDTFGNTYGEAIDVSGDLLTNNEAILNALNGKSASTITDRSVQTLFLVLVNGNGEFTMNFTSPNMSFDATTPNLSVSTMNNINSTPYIAQKTAMGQPTGKSYYDATWRKYNFTLGRNSGRSTYDTAAQLFYFQQVPGRTPSQGIPKPMVISNVSSTTASSTPLILRMTLRDSTNGNIIAYDHTTWSVIDDKTTEGNQWVFVPVEDLNLGNSRVYQYLTTEVANHTSYRYAAAPYDSYRGPDYPDYWKFDISRLQGNTELPHEFSLAPASNIAPGLVTVYKRPYDVNESSKIPLRVFGIDTPETGRFNLRLNHRVIFGQRLGDTYREAAQQGRFNLFEITAYRPGPLNMNFYEKIASVTNARGTVSVPTTSIFTGSSVNNDYSENIPADAVQYFTVNQTIPSGFRTGTNEGMLPLHITFNIPVTLVRDRAWWDSMVEEWRRSGRIEDSFADKYHIYLLTETEGRNNPWNLTQELQEKGVYNDQIKVFFDEERGGLTTDNDSGLITVSFIAMLMNGTRDGVRPELSIVSDESIEQTNNYIIIRDGSNDTKWKMTFFIAPANYVTNPSRTEIDNNNNNKPANLESSGSSGGGCDVIGGALCIMVSLSVLFAFKKRERR